MKKGQLSCIHLRSVFLSYRNQPRDLQSEAANSDALLKKVFLKMLQNFPQNTCARLFLNKVTGLMPTMLSNKDSSTGAFL